jgi:hypothetical protein
MTKVSMTEKIADQAKLAEGGFTPYLDLINKVNDKQVLALAVATLDQTVTRGGFNEWRIKGFSHSKRASRVLNEFLAKLDTPEANTVLKAKKDYIYSVCEKQNVASTEAYKAVRKNFLTQIDNILIAA